ncbi:hypothetical protein SAMN04489740_4084 [Arthrobacter alpinus]|uniref:Uncharacterized protein n=1 Tax=Arthrobacter alpinus TaxID=656366 RepID=A0A1H5PBF9_9MICC|nr:hypothetical protein [Arthrobacter alpinus]SEF11262.1 hypothetical protein SAMN04489740_4084 [Arthrobacter alpinus]
MKIFIILLLAAALLVVAVFLIYQGVRLVNHVSKRVDDLEQVEHSPWLANFEEYCRHAEEEGYDQIKDGQLRDFYIRDIERSRAKKIRAQKNLGK